MNTNSQEKFEVRDLRDKNRFVVDDKFLNGYARFLGIYAIGVYNSLCRHANKNQSSWPSINKIAQELGIGRNKVIDGTKNLEFWQIVKKKRVGLKLTNRYLLLSKTSWKSLDENNLKEFSEVCHMNFRSLQDKLQKFTSSTSIVRKHNIKEIQKKGELSLEKKPHFWGKPIWEDENGKKFVIWDHNDFRPFVGKESEIDWI